MSARFRARKPFRLGPYFRHYSVSSAAGMRPRCTSHGFRFRLGPAGTLTYNITHRRWTWDNPGPGSIQFGGSPRRSPDRA